MRWAGFRKIRARVCKRIGKRVTFLGLNNVSDYQVFLNEHPGEWIELDELCRVTISRFYRDKMVFGFLEHEVLPALAQQAYNKGDNVIRAWSVGCASGEEPYTLSLIWELCLKSQFPDLNMEIVAIDISPTLIKRASKACYQYSSVKNLPSDWRDKAFEQVNGDYLLLPGYKQKVRFQCQDTRHAVPSGEFDLVLCRNLVFTYYDQTLQSEVGEKIVASLKPNGVLVLGIHEHLPEETKFSLEVWSQKLGVYRKKNREALCQIEI